MTSHFLQLHDALRTVVAASAEAAFDARHVTTSVRACVSESCSLSLPEQAITLSSRVWSFAATCSWRLYDYPFSNLAQGWHHFNCARFCKAFAALATGSFWIHRCIFRDRERTSGSVQAAVSSKTRRDLNQATPQPNLEKGTVL